MPYFLSSFYHFLSFFISVLFLLLISNHYLAVGCFPFGLFFLGPSLSVLTTLLPWVFPLRCLCPLGSLFFWCFFSLPCFFLPFWSPFLPRLPSFYSELIQWDFSLLPIGLHQLFLIRCGHPFKITHPPIGCPCHCSVHVCCTATYFMTKFPFVCSCCMPLPHYLILWHASDGPNHLLFLLGKIPSQ